MQQPKTFKNSRLNASMPSFVFATSVSDTSMLFALLSNCFQLQTSYHIICVIEIPALNSPASLEKVQLCTVCVFTLKKFYRCVRNSVYCSLVQSSDWILVHSIGYMPNKQTIFFQANSLCPSPLFSFFFFFRQQFHLQFDKWVFAKFLLHPISLEWSYHNIFELSCVSMRALILCISYCVISLFLYVRNLKLSELLQGRDNYANCKVYDFRIVQRIMKMFVAQILRVFLFIDLFLIK